MPQALPHSLTYVDSQKLKALTLLLDGSDCPREAWSIVQAARILEFLDWSQAYDLAKLYGFDLHDSRF